MKTNLLEVVGQVRRYLEQNGRVSLRMLRRQFDLDDESLEELIEELVDIQRVARREENALAASAATPPVAIPSPERDPRANTPATASWRSSARRSRTRITRSAPATRRCICATSSSATPTNCAAHEA